MLMRGCDSQITKAGMERNEMTGVRHAEEYSMLILIDRLKESNVSWWFIIVLIVVSVYIGITVANFLFRDMSWHGMLASGRSLFTREEKFTYPSQSIMSHDLFYWYLIAIAFVSYIVFWMLSCLAVYVLSCLHG